MPFQTNLFIIMKYLTRKRIIIIVLMILTIFISLLFSFCFKFILLFIKYSISFTIIIWYNIASSNRHFVIEEFLLFTIIFQIIVQVALREGSSNILIYYRISLKFYKNFGEQCPISPLLDIICFKTTVFSVKKN